MNINEIKLAEWGISLDKLGAVVEGKDDVNQCIGIIIRTAKGSDPFRPDFGCDVLGHIDIPQRIAAPGLAKEIATAIGLWEPRIEVKNISYVIEFDRIIFSIDWKYIGSINDANNAIIDIEYSQSGALPVVPTNIVTTENDEILLTELEEIITI